MGDDFSGPAKKALASRVGNLCSNPECRALTSGPQEDPAKALNIGVAAHVTAASPGGPRYDPELLPEERSGPSNGIWLCQNCGKLVDNDPARFTVDLLRGWKATAEAEAKSRIGKTAPAGSAPSFDLRGGDRVRFEPIVPRRAELSDWMLESDSGGCYVFRRWGRRGKSKSRHPLLKGFITSETARRRSCSLQAGFSGLQSVKDGCCCRRNPLAQMSTEAAGMWILTIRAGWVTKVLSHGVARIVWPRF